MCSAAASSGWNRADQIERATPSTFRDLPHATASTPTARSSRLSAAAALAMPTRLLRGCAPLRTQAHRDSPRIPRPCESAHPERGVVWPSDLGTPRRPHRGLLTSRLPFRLPAKGRARMTSAFRVSSQPASSAELVAVGREQRHCPRRRPLGVPERASSPLRHRLSDAGQRRRSRGHRARRLVTLADDGSQRGSGRRRIPRDDGDTIGDQRHAVGTLAPGNVRRALAAGTSRHERRPSVGSRTRPGVGVWRSCCCWKS